MATFTSSSNSSVDLLAAELNDHRSSPVRDSQRVFKRTPSPSKSSRATPTRNNVLQLQDFYIATPDAARNYRASPSRSVAESEKIISPWRIRVRVEAERDDAQDDNELGYRIRKSMSPSKAQSRATTMVVPLNDDSDSSKGPRKPKRTRKSTQRRPPTPKPTRSRKRVLEEIENEESVRSRTPKRSKRQGTSDTGYLVQPSVEEDEAPMLLLDDLLEAAITTDGADKLEQTQTKNAQRDEIPNAKPISPDGMDRHTQSRSPFNFKRQGQDVSIVRVKDPISSHAKARRKLLISDFAEPRAEFDSIMEGEDFTMISLSSVPSAQQHLSLRKETANVSAPVTDAEGTTANHSQSKSRIVRASPIATVQTGAFRTQYTGRRINKTTNQDNTLQLTPSKENQTHLKEKSLEDDETYPLLETGQEGRYLNVQSSDNAGMTTWPGIETEEHPQPDPAKEQDSVSTISSASTNQESPDFERETNVSEQSLFPDAQLSREENENVMDEHSSEIGQPPDYLPEDEDFKLIGTSGSSHAPVRIEVPVSNRRISSSPTVDTNLPTTARTAKKQTVSQEEIPNPDQSSILQLPHNGPTPSKIFSSPVLPDITLHHEKSAGQSLRPVVETPRLTRVVKAGKALQYVVEPMVESKLNNASGHMARQSPKASQEHLFSGFSVASRRELRAGLRLGEELAKRQSSMLDITMDSAPSPISTEPRAQTYTTFIAEPKSINNGVINDKTTLQYPELPKQYNSQLPSPETSSNDTQQKQTSMIEHTDGAQDMKDLSEIYYSRNSHLQPEKTEPIGISVMDSPAEVDNDGFQDDLDNEYQDEGFASDDDHESEPGPGPGPISYDETDVWQLEARAASSLSNSVQDQQHIVTTSHLGTIVHELLPSKSPYPKVDTEHNEDEFDEDSLELHEFDEEQAAVSSRIHSPSKFAGILTPSDTTSSPNARTKPVGQDFTNFTNFTQDLLQAAYRQPRQTIASKTSQEQVKNQTPITRVLKERDIPYADVFTTRSLLETSAASIKSRKSPMRKGLSFRPTDRKESWLFDPKRLRKPPSPLKQAQKPSPANTFSDSLSSPSTTMNPKSKIPKQTADSTLYQSSISQPQKTALRHGPEDAVDQPSKEPPSTPDHRFVDSSPLSIFVAAAKKREANNVVQGRSKSSEFQDRITNRQPQDRQASNSIQRLTLVSQPVARQTQAQRKPKEILSSSSRPNSSAQDSGPSTAQSSFISNPSTNTSLDDSEIQTTWLSFLTSVTTPLIASTKAISQFATTALQQSQQQTFYPTSTRSNTEPALLTKHQPFNDAHWTALRSLYIAALKQPSKFPLNLSSRCAEYLGLEIESLGWKRELQEWELAVVARFLRFLHEEGVQEDSEQPPIDIEAIIKRVFSLWVGMVTRGELRLAEGKAGAWDRRFVGRRSEVLQKQKDWLKSRV